MEFQFPYVSRAAAVEGGLFEHYGYEPRHGLCTRPHRHFYISDLAWGLQTQKFWPT